MTATPLPPPSVAIADKDGKPTIPFYNYFTAADRTWRRRVTTVATTVNALIPNDGITVLTTPSTQTLANPEPGVKKTLIVTSTSTTARIVSASTTTQILPGTGWRLVFGSSAANKVITLVGVTTSQWFIESNPGSVTVTT